MPSKSQNTKKSSVRSSSRGALWPPVGISRTIILAILVLASTLGVYYVEYGSAAQAELQSGIGGNGGGGSQCLDQNGGIYNCNGSDGEKWGGLDSYGRIHVNTLCMAQSGASSTVGVGSSAQGRAVVGVPCGSTAPWGGSWYWSGHTLHNKHAESKGGSYCLDVRGGALNGPVETYSCNGGSNQQWYVGSYGTTTSGGGTSGGSGTTTSAGQAIFYEAMKYVGREQESPNGCNCGGTIIDGGNINTFQKLPQGVSGYPAGWCAFFVSWVYYKAGHDFGSAAGYQPIGSTNGIRDWFAARGKFYYNNSYNRAHHPPSKGDFVDYENGGHAGVVDKVYNGTLFSIDGNFSNGVNWDQTNGYATSGTVTGWGHL